MSYASRKVIFPGGELARTASKELAHPDCVQPAESRPVQIGYS
jgi:hypothetical protein